MHFTKATKSDVRSFIGIVKKFMSSYGFSASEAGRICGIESRSQFGAWLSGRRNPSKESIIGCLSRIQAVEIAFLLNQ